MVLRIFKFCCSRVGRLLLLILLFFVYFVIFYNRKYYNYIGPKGAVNWVTNQPGILKVLDVDISKKIEIYNSKMNIVKNLDIYGPINEDTVIFVILVHTLTKKFNLLIESLSQVRGIEGALIIFSHSFYDENMNEIISGIHFCRVLQIFYPYSLQTHSRAFPGRHPSDCPTDMDKKTAKALNCTGAHFPDVRGRYRSPVKAKTKHHWWWTANTVFERLNCTTKHFGLVIFLQNDFYFLQDFIYMAMYMKNVARSVPQCEFLSIGSSSSPSAGGDNIYAAELATWDPKIHSSVLAFDVTTWNIVASHYDLFCSVDDSSWIRSLYYISLNRKDGEMFKVLSSVVPRAFRISECDFYGLFGCNNVENIVSFQNQNEGDLFPPYLEVYINIELEDDMDVVFDYGESEGGWADPRDKQLCAKITERKMKKILMEMDVSDDYKSN